MNYVIARPKQSLLGRKVLALSFWVNLPAHLQGHLIREPGEWVTEEKAQQELRNREISALIMRARQLFEEDQTLRDCREEAYSDLVRLEGEIPESPLTSLKVKRTMCL